MCFVLFVAATQVLEPKAENFYSLSDAVAAKSHC